MAAAKSVPFLFDRDFRRGSTSASEPEAPIIDAAALAEAEARGFERGRQAGFASAADNDAARLAGALERVGALLIGEVAREKGRAQDTRAAIDLALAFSQKLAGRALARQPLADIEAAALRCFAEAQHAPHLAVRVHEAFVDAVKKRLTTLAAEKGFAGKLVVLGDPEIAPGDARVEWADGGIVRDRAEVGRAIQNAIDAYFAAHDERPGKEPK